MSKSGMEPAGVTIFEKSDQRFNDVATAFEKSYSELCYPMGPFHPIVDPSMMVVAHYGEVMGSQLISIKLDGDVLQSIQDSYLKENFEQDCAHGTCWYHKKGEGYKGGPIRVGGPRSGDWPVPADSALEVQARVAAEIPVYVRDDKPEGWTSVGYSEWSKWAVLVLPDGEVLHAELISKTASNNGTANSTWAPWDVFSLGRLGAKVAGNIAKRVLAQAGRLGYRLLVGPTKELVKRIQARFARKALNAGKIFLQESDGVLAVIKDGKILARAPVTGMLSHEKFVVDKLGKDAIVKKGGSVELAPKFKGAEVVTIGKHRGDVGAIRSKTFHGNESWASNATQDAVKREYH
jgi:hypothetical protein